MHSVQHHPYRKIRNTLFSILILLTLFMSILYSVDKLQNKTNTTDLIYIKQEEKSVKVPLRGELKEVITHSIIKNLQAQKEHISMDDNFIKLVVAKIIHNIETSPKKITYTAQEGE